MKTITGDDGLTYVLKSDMENIIKERVSKVAEKARQHEETNSNLQKELDELKTHVTSSDILADQVSKLKTELANQKQRYDRYTKISQYGLYDSDMVDLVEWTYERATKDLDGKKKPTLETWLETCYNDIEKAPMTLRPHLERLKTNTETETESPEMETDLYSETDSELPSQMEPQLQTREPQPPRLNGGATPPPTDGVLASARFQDLEWYSQNRDRIISELRAKRGR